MRLIEDLGIVEYRYVGLPVLNSGNTESFVKNIVNSEEVL